ncbi:hypothetical protein FA10DRAFT_14594 [Acaromyces ingoldii]|uniref:Secreted protein n=1 Tax=Acaromyces ingoldii TaxID=215250 RepID=A0A316YV30_9BASI|nr:hypothetical protein FA10DRAFT_14594 [Acaromyces ingoldii]PWN93139.1 hypothetical protein FA10DRAFT_14594 [Acaromyces ingoldii]
MCTPLSLRLLSSLFSLLSSFFLFPSSTTFCTPPSPPQSPLRQALVLSAVQSSQPSHLLKRYCWPFARTHPSPQDSLQCPVSKRAM